MIEEILTELAKQGILALILAYTLWRLREKDQQLHASLTAITEAHQQEVQLHREFRAWLEGRLEHDDRGRP